MKATKNKIYDILVEKLTELNTIPPANGDHDQICRFLFSNYRKNNGEWTGLQLRKEAYLVLKNHYQMYEFNMPEEFQVKPYFIIMLDNISNYPWYLTKHLFSTMDEDVALYLKLCGNDLDTLYKRYMVKYNLPIIRR